MPCNDYTHTEEMTEMQMRLNSATRVACTLASRLETHEPEFYKSSNLNGLGDEVKKWVRNHKKQDALRLEEEARERKRKRLKKRALKKLSQKERKALGLC